MSSDHPFSLLSLQIKVSKELSIFIISNFSFSPPIDPVLALVILNQDCYTQWSILSPHLAWSMSSLWYMIHSSSLIVFPHQACHTSLVLLFIHWSLFFKSPMLVSSSWPLYTGGPRAYLFFILIYNLILTRTSLSELKTCLSSCILELFQVWFFYTELLILSTLNSWFLSYPLPPHICYSFNFVTL